MLRNWRQPPARKTSGFIPKCRNTAPEEFLGVTPPPYPGTNGFASRDKDPEAPQPHTRWQLMLLNFAEKKGHAPRPDNFRCYVKESPPERKVSGFLPKCRNTAPEEVLGVTPPPYPGTNGFASRDKDPEAPQTHTRGQLILLNFAEKKGVRPSGSGPCVPRFLTLLFSGGRFGPGFFGFLPLCHP